MTDTNITAWDIDPAAFPAGGSLDDKIRFAVRCAILAPSSHNTQPWRFAITAGELILSADRTRSLPVADPFDRELIMSCGAALFNLRVAFTRFALPFEIATFPQAFDRDAIARVTFPRIASVGSDPGQLFDAIPRRVTNRQAFADESPPAHVLDLVRAGAAAEGVDATLVQSSTDRTDLAALVVEADRQQFSDPHFRSELASWIHPSRSGDGMPAYALAVSMLTDAATPLLSLAVRTFDVGEGAAASHEKLMRGSPLLAILSTRLDSNEAWLAAGQALQRILLGLTQVGYSASFLNQPVEVPELREQLAKQMKTPPYPQLVLQIGRGPAARHSPRRALSDVLS